jgi:coenzyme F420-0:L-glutamate ligase/coenzyme F420-1:gamma-L-glutamate ligase
VSGTAPGALSFEPIFGLPEIRPGDDLVDLLAEALDARGQDVRDGDVFVLAQKIVSKAEDRYVDLASVEPRPEALEIADRCHKDARFVELVLRESTETVRVAPHVLIVRHRHGFVVANAGIDRSNLPGSPDLALLLPADPDRSAEVLRTRLEQCYEARLAVLISDSFGRPWRMGVCGVCIGCSGLESLVDLRGTADRSGRPLQVTQLAIADQLCATATLVCGEAAEGVPAVIVRGVPRDYLRTSRGADALVRPLEQDLFR